MAPKYLKVRKDNTVYRSIQPLLIAVAHGRRVTEPDSENASPIINQHSVLAADGSFVSSQWLLKNLNQILVSKNMPRIAVFLSCDDQQNRLRLSHLRYSWTDLVSEPRVISFSGDDVFEPDVVDDYTWSINIDTWIAELMKEFRRGERFFIPRFNTPFTDQKHVHRPLVEMLFEQRQVLKLR